MSGSTALITETSLRGSATLQLAAGRDGVVLDTLSWDRGTDGHSRQEHSVARLSRSNARRYRVLLGDAIAAAGLPAIDQPAMPCLRRVA
jgi:hypothetical protein